MAFFFSTLLVENPVPVFSASCTPTSAVMTAAGDDVTNIWINGCLLGTFNYVSKGTGALPVSMILSAAQLSCWVPGGPNCLSIRTTNTICCETLVSWVLDVTCSGAPVSHVYMTSDNVGPLDFYWDSSGLTPPPNNGGLSWQDPNWVNPLPLVYFKDTSVCLNEFFWSKRIYSPVTGQLLCPRAPVQAPQNIPPLADMFYRQCQPITLVAPPGPPAFTITKSAMGPISQINSGMNVTYAVTICNNGGFVSTPVTVLDNKPPGFSYGGPWNPSPPQGPYGDPFIFSEGFPGNGACTTLNYWLINYSVNPADYCQTRTNSVSVQGYSAAATASVTMYCPGNTNTFTPTGTYTPTFTWTNTPVPNTHTFTPTFTRTNTYTPTFTWTNTFPGNTYTPTITYTPTRTYTPTFTWTITVTPTPLPGCRIPSCGTRYALAPSGRSAQERCHPQTAVMFNPSGVQPHGTSGIWVSENGSLGPKQTMDFYPSRNAGSGPVDVRLEGNYWAMISREKSYVRPL